MAKNLNYNTMTFIIEPVIKYVIIDVREPEEFLAGHVAGAINIPPREILAGLADLKSIDKNSKIIVYCRTGARSAVALNIFYSLGYNNVVNGINKSIVESNFDL